MESNTRPRKVLHIFGKMDRGGAEMRTLDIMRTIDRNELQLEFCALSGSGGELDTEISSLGGKVHKCKLDARFPLKFIQLLKRERYDVVHSHVYLTSGLTLGLAAMAGVPVRIAHFRTTGTDRPRTGRQRIQDATGRFLIQRFATNIVAVSEGAMTSAWREEWQADPRCEVIYTGVPENPWRRESSRRELRSEYGISPATDVYVHVGRFDPPKNHQRLVTIFAEIVRRKPDSALVLIGRGGNRIEAEFRKASDDLGVSGHIHILGERSDVPRLLTMADCLLLPSKREGLPGAVLEATAAGLPVVASRLPGIEEIAREIHSVTPVALGKPDKFWADAVIDSLAESAAHQVELRETSFSLEVSVNKHVLLWLRTESGR